MESAKILQAIETIREKEVEINQKQFGGSFTDGLLEALEWVLEPDEVEASWENIDGGK